MRHFVVLAVISLLLHGYLVEGQGGSSVAPGVPTVPGGGSGGSVTLASGATPAGSATTCLACSTNVSTDGCADGTTGSGATCGNGVCIVELEEDADGNIVTFERKCHGQACNSDNENSVFTEASSSTTGGTHYEECCAEAADCNSIPYTDLKSTAGKLTAGMAAILFGAICLLVL